jgi:cell division protein FtsB
VFLDQNSIISQYDDNQQLIEAKKNKLFYMKKLKETKYNLDLLLSDNEHLEQFARENFWMKKPNEDLFIIAEKSEKPVE